MSFRTPTRKKKKKAEKKKKRESLERSGERTHARLSSLCPPHNRSRRRYFVSVTASSFPFLSLCLFCFVFVFFRVCVFSRESITRLIPVFLYFSFFNYFSFFPVSKSDAWCTMEQTERVTPPGLLSHAFARIAEVNRDRSRGLGRGRHPVREI